VKKREQIKQDVHLNLDYAFAVLFIFAYFNVSHLHSIMTYQQHKFNEVLNLNSSKNKRSIAIQTDVSKPKYTALQQPVLNESKGGQGKLYDT
jgi:hypothetical protein